MSDAPHRCWLGLGVSTVVHVVVAAVGLLVPPPHASRALERGVVIVELVAAEPRVEPAMRTPEPRRVPARAVVAVERRIEPEGPPRHADEPRPPEPSVAAEPPAVPSHPDVAPVEAIVDEPAPVATPSVMPELEPSRAAAAPPVAPGRGEGVARPTYQSTPRPDYPSAALRQGHEGVVLLNVQVLQDGTVGEIRLERSSGHDLLDRAAIKAVRGWKFRPARRDDRPVDDWVTVPVRFAMSRS